MFLLALYLCLGAGVIGAEYTLPGECPDVKLQENLDPTKVSLGFQFERYSLFSLCL